MDQKPHVLIIDEERAIRRFLRTLLKANYKISEAKTGEGGLQQVSNTQPDIVILDPRLPDIDGVEIIQRLHALSDLLIMVISAKDSDKHKISAFNAGADDYLTKPFSIGELMARMRVLLRRREKSLAPEVLRTGELEVNLSDRMVKVKGKMVQLTPTEYSILELLVQHAGKVLTHQKLWQHIRTEQEYEPHVLHVHVSNMRRKLEHDSSNPRWILTETGLGYRLYVE